jgi:hypothetical protein
MHGGEVTSVGREREMLRQGHHHRGYDDGDCDGCGCGGGGVLIIIHPMVACLPHACLPWANQAQRLVYCLGR